MRPASFDHGMDMERAADSHLAAEGLGGICVLIQLRGRCTITCCCTGVMLHRSAPSFFSKEMHPFDLITEFIFIVHRHVYIVMISIYVRM